MTPPVPAQFPIPSPAPRSALLHTAPTVGRGAGAVFGTSPPPLDFESDADVGDLQAQHFAVPTLGPCDYDSPRRDCRYGDQDKILFQNHSRNPRTVDPYLAFECAGARSKIHFDPKNTTVGIVTCGGICPGLNDVIRAITYSALNYGVKRVIGFRYGYQGMSRAKRDYIELTYQNVNQIHYMGGTCLGTSRGEIPAEEMLETLQLLNVNCMFTIGGDGTQRGSATLFSLIQSRQLDIAVVGIPKTIDNDIPFISRSFGFDTAVEVARDAINGAHIEATSVTNGLGIVKLMGRDAGFIAAKSTLSSGDVNFCLVPEEPFDLNLLLERLEQRFEARGHAVLVVAEGAGVPQLIDEGHRLAEEKMKADVALAYWAAHHPAEVATMAEKRAVPGVAAAPIIRPPTIMPAGPAPTSQGSPSTNPPVPAAEAPHSALTGQLASGQPTAPTPANPQSALTATFAGTADKSGNVKFGDIGIFLKKKIEDHFKGKRIECNTKYIDPSYLIRSVRANANDSAFCIELAQKAVDSALAGKTGCVVGYWNDEYTLVPFSMIARGGKKKINLRGHLWNSVKSMTEL
eukprot:GAFH01001030.1.p1 GENE.GAFH01001030.1~~GAFH01001030.1.p1  ORF type:complete len:611 (-),score=196.53 GAFH01001030.1:257-1975(-)